MQEKLEKLFSFFSLEQELKEAHGQKSTKRDEKALKYTGEQKIPVYTAVVLKATTSAAGIAQQRQKLGVQCQIVEDQYDHTF